MVVSDLIYYLKEVKKQYGDIEVVKSSDEELWACAGYVSCTGQVYSAYDLKQNAEHYKEEASEFDLEKDVVFVL